jgi:hypothetical protein
MRPKFLMLAILAVTFSGTAANAVSWLTYANGRFGAIAAYPSDWKAGDPPYNDDGLSFTSPDGAGKISI